MPPIEPHHPLASRERLIDALRAVREAIGIPHWGTVRDQEARNRIPEQRAGYAAAMLGSILSVGEWPPRHTEYLRARLAEHPAQGYKTWEERMAELDAIIRAERGGDEDGSDQ